MTYTRHGFLIPKTAETKPPLLTGNCGGPESCLECRDDSRVALRMRDIPLVFDKDGVAEQETEASSFMGEDPLSILGRPAVMIFGDNQFVSKHPDLPMQEKAMTFVTDYIEAGLKENDDKPEYDVFIVWFAKVLQNWKALVGSTLPDQEYYEVTYNGDKKETYLDVYVKHANIVLKD
jgi:hypothetical protein